MIDREFAKRRTLLINSTRLVTDYFHGETASEAVESLHRKYTGARVLIEFNPSAGVRKRERALEGIAMELGSADAQLRGELPIPKNMRKVVDSISVREGAPDL